MAGLVGWIDFDQSERDRVNRVLEAFKDKGMLDELGFGRIRDSFADLLAPGITSAQRRLRYFFFIPWICQQLEKKRVPPEKFGRKLKAAEIELIYALERGGDERGIIGILSRETLTTFPSTIYWGGLADWGFLRFRGSIGDYKRSVGSLYRLRDSTVYGDDGEPVSGLPAQTWHPGMPSAPTNFLKKTSFELRSEEAEFLVERIQQSPLCQGTLLQFLLQPDLIQAADMISAPWTHPLLNTMPADLRDVVTHAQNFSELTRGASLTYNAFLAQRRDAVDVEDDLRTKLDGWFLGTFQPRRAAFERFDWTEFKRVVDRAPGHHIRFERTIPFLRHWLEQCLAANNAADLLSNQSLRLVREREFAVKGRRARLSNPRMLEKWTGESGTNPFLFRWGQLSSYVTDVAHALDVVQTPEHAPKSNLEERSEAAV